MKWCAARGEVEKIIYRKRLRAIFQAGSTQADMFSSYTLSRLPRWFSMQLTQYQRNSAFIRP